MGLDLSRFLALRPRLLHVTTPANARRIAGEGWLRPAGDTLAAAGLHARVHERRSASMLVRIPTRSDDAQEIYLRDQIPLKAGNMRLEGGWTLATFIGELNAHVFFWPAGQERAGAYARRLFERYGGLGQVVMSFDSARLIAANRSSLRVCSCNSGAPRCNPTSGKAPRGPGTFSTIEAFDHPSARVQEVAFRSPVRAADAMLDTTPVERWIEPD